MEQKAFLMLAALLLVAFPACAELVPRSGEKVAFLGDSITAQGWTNPHGYVRLVVAGLQANGVTVEPIPAGVGGNTSSDMLARLKRDVLDKKPDRMLVSCGMNDVIHGAKGVPLDQYKINMAALVGQVQQCGIKVVLLTTTLAGKWDSDASKKLGDNSAVLRELARVKKCGLVDLYPVFVEAAKTADTLHGLTGDGVHLTPEGNILMARTILKTFGCSEAQVEQARQAWLDIPHAGDISARVDVVLNKQFFHTTCALTLREREKLLAAAQAAKKPTLMHWSKDLLAALMKKKVQPAGAYTALDALFAPGVREKVQAELQSEFEQSIRSIVEGK